MNTRIFALTALTIAGALNAGTANAYMGDGCGHNAQLQTSPYSGRSFCRPIMREPVQVLPVVPAYPRFVPVAPAFGGYGGPGRFQGPIRFGGFQGGFVPGYGRAPISPPVFAGQGGYGGYGGYGAYGGRSGHGPMMGGR